MSTSKRLWAPLWIVALLALPAVAMADPKDEIPVTGIAWMDTGLKFLGAAYLFLTALVAMLPKTIPLVQAIARWVGDVRNAAKEGAKVQIAKATLRNDQRGFGDVRAIFAMAGLALLLAVVSFCSGGCAAAKPACDVIRVADDACQVFLITLPDGTTERVPRSELTRFATARRQLRMQGGAQ